ncbi:MAG: PEP-CTERM sorting domain-containing protein [Chthoniobacter sp.]
MTCDGNAGHNSEHIHRKPKEAELLLITNIGTMKFTKVPSDECATSYLASSTFPTYKRLLRSAGAKVTILAGAALLACGIQVAGAAVIFSEPFTLGASNWTNNGSTPVTWTANGGPLGVGDGFITATALSPGNNSVVIRATASNSASGGAFTGNWISEGVATFSIDIMQDSGSIMNFGLRFASSAGFPAGNALSLSVPSGTWTHFDIPISSTSSALSYPEGGDFNGIFSSIGNVQLFIPGTTTPADVHVSVDNATISGAAVPEPTTLSLLSVAGVCGLSMSRRRKR